MMQMFFLVSLKGKCCLPATNSWKKEIRHRKQLHEITFLSRKFGLELDVDGPAHACEELIKASLELTISWDWTIWEMKASLMIPCAREGMFKKGLAVLLRACPPELG